MWRAALPTTLARAAAVVSAVAVCLAVAGPAGASGGRTVWGVYVDTSLAQELNPSLVSHLAGSGINSLMLAPGITGKARARLASLASHAGIRTVGADVGVGAALVPTPAAARSRAGAGGTALVPMSGPSALRFLQPATGRGRIVALTALAAPVSGSAWRSALKLATHNAVIELVVRPTGSGSLAALRTYLSLLDGTAPRATAKNSHRMTKQAAGAAKPTKKKAAKHKAVNAKMNALWQKAAKAPKQLRTTQKQKHLSLAAIWGVYVDATLARALGQKQLAAFRRAGINTLLAPDAVKGKQRASLIRMARSKKIRVLGTHLGVGAKSVTTPRAARAAALHGRVVILRVRRAATLNALQKLNGHGRVVAVVTLSAGLNRTSWRRAISAARESSALDLVIRPTGRKRLHSVSSYLALLSAPKSAPVIKSVKSVAAPTAPPSPQLPQAPASSPPSTAAAAPSSGGASSSSGAGSSSSGGGSSSGGTPSSSTGAGSSGGTASSSGGVGPSSTGAGSSPASGGSSAAGGGSPSDGGAASGGDSAPANYPSGAAVFVSPSGSDSSCVRGDASRPCGSFDRAYRLAQCGDVVGVAAGTYRGQTVLYDSGKSGCAGDPVVFEGAGVGRTVVGARTQTTANIDLYNGGDIPVVSTVGFYPSASGNYELLTGNSTFACSGATATSFSDCHAESTCQASSGDECGWVSGTDLHEGGINVDGASFVTFRAMTTQTASAQSDGTHGASYVSFDGLHSYGGYTNGDHISYVNGECGPSSANERCVYLSGATNATISHMTIHDYTIGCVDTAEQPSANDFCHGDAFYVSGNSTGLSYIGNRSYGNEPWTLFFSNAGDYSGLRIENNFFGRDADYYTMSLRLKNVTVSNVVIRGNSFAQSPIWGAASGATSTAWVNWLVTGNIGIDAPACTGSIPSGFSTYDLTYTYNVAAPKPCISTSLPSASGNLSIRTVAIAWPKH